MSKLYVIPTPIGNLKDITLRALETLKEVDEILCEDTRTSGRLLKHYDIDKPLKAYHLNNEHKIKDRVVEKLKLGTVMALITDAGTPAISDPGYLLIRECVNENIDVEVLPGATAFVTALVASGMPCEKFVYEGFLPHKKGRQTRFEAMAVEPRTIVFYESPHRLLKTLNSLVEFCGPDRQVSVSRELTKMYEETVRGTTTEALAHFTKNAPRGEFVICLHGVK
jgi:16S rRNA (cytidine1402-2'-O)-methyltransferase